jgi:hypothetical protein
MLCNYAYSDKTYMYAVSCETYAYKQYSIQTFALVRS